MDSTCKDGQRVGLWARNVATAALLLLLGVWFWQFHGSYIDDAYITLAYARTLVESHVWGMHPDLVSNGATSPLGVLSLAALIQLGVQAEVAIYTLNILLSALLLWSLIVIHRMINHKTAWFSPYLTVLLLCTNPLLVSTLGLETYLYVVLFLVAIALRLRERLTAAAIVAGLLVLVRPDGVIPAVIVLAEMMHRRKSGKLRLLLLSLAIPFAWYLFSWLQLGSLFPDTVLIKKAQARGSFDYFHGPVLYFRRFSKAGALTLMPVALVAFFSRASLRSEQAIKLLSIGLLSAGLVYGLYGIGSVPPYHWYYGFPVAVVITGASLFSLRVC